MNHRWLFTLLAFLVAIASASAHDLFLRLDTYFLQPNSKATVRLLNGTFQSSDGLVARERLREVSLKSPDIRATVAAITWRAEDTTTIMEVQTGGAGTYVAGISTRPKEITLKAADFNDYLQHDGLPDTLAARKKDNELGKDVRERYSKHVRAVFQVGSALSEDYKKPLNYPVEIIPQLNPYTLKVGLTIPVLCLYEGQPIPHQFVMAGRESSDGKLHTLEARTDAKGIANIKLDGAGKWFIKFIHMTPLSQPDLNYESKWASLTFEIR
jgi:predicted RNA-binding protein